MSLTLQAQDLLVRLQEAGFEFVVIRGVAAVAHGASTPTRDLDVAAPMTPDNLTCLLAALNGLHAKHATRPDLGEISESADSLSRYRLLLLDTDLGRLDVLKTVDPIGEHDRLASIELELVEGRRFRVLTLDQLIEVKAHLGRLKDRVVETELRAIRDLLRSERRPEQE